MAVQPVPPGFHTLTPYLMVEGAQKLIEFLQTIFGAEVKHITKHPDGLVMHATICVGDSMLMLSDARSPWPAFSVHLYVYLPNVDEVYERAIKAGATSISAPRNEFYGDRMAGVKDAFGNSWWMATHIEDVNDEELDRRRQKIFGGQGKH